MEIYTVGHSTHPVDEFIDLLGAHGIDYVADIRSIPRSRHNPQFNSAELDNSLAGRGLGYEWIESLGGLRHTNKNSNNGAWRNASFRGYADYMQTGEFARAIGYLVDLGARSTVAIMCAEAVPWRCHRSLVGDSLLVRGIDVFDIMSPTQAKAHALTSFARVDGQRVWYPPS